MKKILAVLIALLIAALPMIAMAENADWIQEALEAGRELTMNVTCNTIDESSEPQPTVNLTFTVRENPAMFSMLTKIAEETLTDFAFYTDDEGAIYLKSNLLGKTVAFTQEEIIMMAETILDALENSGLIDAIEAELSAQRAEQMQFEAEFNAMSESLNLTPILLVLFDLRNNVNMVDVEDYKLDVKRLASQSEEAPEAPEAAEAAEAEVSAADQFDSMKDISMYVVLTLSQDDVQRLLNALMETIAINPSLYAMFGNEIDSTTEYFECIIERMSEDFNLVIGLDVDGQPEYASTTFALSEEGGNISSYMIEMSKEVQEDLSGMAITFKVSDENSEDWQEICSIGGYASNERAEGHFTLTPEKDFALTLSFDAVYPAATETEQTIDVETKLEVVSGEETDAIVCDMNVDLKKVDEDVEGTVDMTVNELYNEQKKEISSIQIDLATAEAEVFVPGDAVFPIELDEDEQLALLSELAENFTNALTGIMDTLSAVYAK